MKKLYVVVGAALLLLLGLLAVPRLTHAQSFHSGTNVNLSSSQPIHQTVFAAGNTVDIHSEVFGDIFCAGQTVTISGPVHGDIICAGQTVSISGKVDGDVRLAGQTVTLSAPVSGNATVAAQTFDLDSNGAVSGDVSAFFNTANFNGSVGRDVAVGGHVATFNNQVGRNITASLTTMKLASGARIGGGITLTSSTPPVKSSGAVVAGKTSVNAPAQTSHHNFAFFSFAWILYWLVSMVVMAIVLVLLFPHFFQLVTDRALPTPWRALLVGFLVELLLPALVIFLLVTIIGIPLAILVIVGWTLILLLSGPIFAFYLGRLMMRGTRQVLLVMLIGAIVLAILYVIPFLNILAIVATVWIGSGMLLLELFHRTPRPAYIAPETRR